MAKKTAAGGKIKKVATKVKPKAPATTSGATGGNRFVGKSADKKIPDVKIQPARIEKKRG